MARVEITSLTRFITAIFIKRGAARPQAATIAKALVAADIDGTASHGVMLAPMYVDRIIAGSVRVDGDCPTLSDKGATVVLDGRNNAGQLSSRMALELLLARAPVHGLASVAVRNGFHFGAAGYWASQMADAGLIGIVMSNTRPLMPAPGGAQAVVGNNPIAIAVPTAGGPPICLDMATSASAMGKIRMANQKGEPIPEGWATDAKGDATTNAAEAIKGMLLPAAGAKGFGLALMIDILCGALSGGGAGKDVQPLYGNAATPYNCAHFFLAVDPAHFTDPAQFRAVTSALTAQIHQSKRAAGTSALFVPGEIKRGTAGRNAASCPVADETLAALARVAEAAGVTEKPEIVTPL